MQLRLHRTEKLHASPVPTLSRGVCVEAAGAKLRGALDVPAAARGLVLFASSRNLGRIDPRQANLARELNRRGLGTLLFDLVEGTDSAGISGDVDVLTERLLGATAWSAAQWGVEDLPIGYVGSGLGSAAALSAAAKLGREIGAVASHAGRPDLATADLGEVRAPTLLVVDARDSSLVAANEVAAAQLRCPQRLRKERTREGQGGSWAATPAVCRWMEWHLGAPEVPYEPRLILG
jgi:putative phosphoribosyl transferase